MKKIIFLFTVIFTIQSFSQSEKLIGKWGNCSSTCNGTTVTKNVCAEIEFKLNHTVSIGQLGKVGENLNWKITGNEITFLNLSRKKRSKTFSESKIYILKFNESFTELKITEKGKEKCYDLLWRESNVR